MIRAVLFDLDGTLSFMDNEEFMRNYVGLLVPRFSHLYSPDKFAKQLMRSTDFMVKEPKPGRTNLQTFFDDFSKAVGIPFSVLWPIFEEYYEHDFPNLEYLVEKKPEGKKAVDTALRQGYLTAVAANPVMPLKAIKERIRWAGLTPEQFKVIPSIEEFHFCKPHPGFFSELAEALAVEPSQCLMVGNHPVEDLAARQVGMKTFLLETGAAEAVETDYRGDLSELTELLLLGNL
ncbi:phosphoglycolate phosphatase [Peptococcaceae bacterium CEB3]|nr:phosphoglycolate phosphatase [Peptococcaceae bacterium CEB3]